jgi:hydroxymethylpyrimidine pyrophosphatase-like HAD family hydrolase
MDKRPKTIFCDIDGTLFEHKGDICSQHLGSATLLPGVKSLIQEWDRNGYHIILVTGRRESVRKDTERQLAEAGIFHDQLVMGVGGGVRVLINDRKPSSEDDTAVAINITRNYGLEYTKI